MKRKEFLKVCAAGLSTLAFPAIVRSQSTVRLRLAHASPETTSQQLALLQFAKNIKEASQGEIDIRVYPNSQLGNDATVLGGVRGGTIDMMHGGGILSGLVPECDGLELPFLYSDPAHVYRVLDGEVGQSVFARLPEFGLQGLAWLENGFRCITTRHRAVRTPEDVRGLKIRVLPSPIHILTFKLLGANPVPMPIAELYQALESGAVDAQEHPITVAHSAKYYEVQKHLTMTRHVYTALPLIMNKGKFDALSKAHQALLLEHTQQAAQWQRQNNLENEKRLIEDFRKQGMQVLESYDADAFRKVVEAETRKEFTAKVGHAGAELLKRIDALRS